MTPKVSLLVSVYNVSPYIERCAHSLFSQTFTDMEYIFVDDASPDDSMAKLETVLKQYPERKERVKIIRFPINQGTAIAKITAIHAASGEYIAMVDSDDYIEPDMIETLYECAEKEKADIVVSDIIMEYSGHSLVVSDFVADSKEENIRNMLTDEITFASLCNKLIRKELYNREDCRGIQGMNYLEDQHLILRLYYYAGKIVKADRAFYHYIQYNTHSITKAKNRMHFENSLLFWDLLDKFLTEKGIREKYREEIEFAKVKNKCRLMADTASYSLRKKYADMLSNNEMKYLKKFKRGERLMLWLVHYRLFLFAHWLHKFSWYKNKNIPRESS